MTEWIKCSDRMPEVDPGTVLAWVLATDGRDIDVACLYHDDDDSGVVAVWSSEYNSNWAVTHWMPLPELPEVE